MDTNLHSGMVLEPTPPWSTMLKRGFAKHCPRCGGGRLYRGWFRMLERCPTCGFKFERENGFFVGAYLINFAIVEGMLFVAVMAYVVMLDRQPQASMAGPVAAGIVLAVVCPIFFYPFSRTIWSAIDLAMSPIDLQEIVAAQDHVGAAATDPAACPGQESRGP